MITVDRSVHFNEPPAKVFDFLVDLTHEPEWNPDVKHIELLGSGLVETGMKARGSYRGMGDMDIVATDLRRPLRAVFKTTGPKMDMSVVFRFSDEGGGTRFEAHIEMEPKGIMRLLTPLMKSQVKKTFNARPEQMRAGLRNYDWQPAPLA